MKIIDIQHYFMRIKYYKALLCFLVLVLFLIPKNLIHAQTVKRNNIKINYWAPFKNNYSFYYERKFGSRYSFQIHPGVIVNSSTGYFTENAIFISPEFRYYFKKDSLLFSNGFYIGTFLKYKNYTIESETSSVKSKYNSFGGGLVIGYQFLIKKRITLDLFTGIGCYYEFWKSGSRVYISSLEEPGLLGINIYSTIGYAF